MLNQGDKTPRVEKRLCVGAEKAYAGIGHYHKYSQARGYLIFLRKDITFQVQTEAPTWQKPECIEGSGPRKWEWKMVAAKIRKHQPSWAEHSKGIWIRFSFSSTSK